VRNETESHPVHTNSLTCVLIQNTILSKAALILKEGRDEVLGLSLWFSGTPVSATFTRGGCVNSGERGNDEVLHIPEK
jgi:hypothetical protein